MPRRHNRQSSLPRAIHHVMARGDDRQAIVSRQSDRRAFVAHLGDVAAANDVAIHAYCLMDNHYHLILEVPRGCLAATLLHLGRWRVESVPWRFKSIPVDAGRYLVALSRYLHRNPIRAGLATNPTSHRWSSYRVYAGLAIPPAWLHTESILGMFGGDVGEAKELYRRFVEDKLNGPLDVDLQRLLRAGAEKAEKGTDLFSAAENKSVPFSVPLDTIMATVASHHHVPLDTLLDKGRKRNNARDVALYLATHHSGLPLHMVGRSFGGIKPPAVVMRCRAVRARLAADANFQSHMESITASLRAK